MKLSTAAIVVYRRRLFIAKRVPGGDMGNKWEFPGGKAEGEEGAKKALLREIMEEFGVPAKIGNRIAYSSFTHDNTEHRLEAYLARFSDYCFSLAEHTNWQWADFNEIEALNRSGEFTPSDYALLPQIRKVFAKAEAQKPPKTECIETVPPLSVPHADS
jgi:8-oxo-dGTP diphosphatase